jgi:bifunctional non-homologous end joining protein LigD
MPGYIGPCDPVLRKVPPSGDDWLYEIKWDGYRAQLHIGSGKIIVYSRKGFDWTDRFAAIALAAKDLRVREAVIDGEAVVLGSKGIADFQALRRELGKEDSERLTYYAFDLLWLNGKDLRSLPLVERKERLRKLIDGKSPRLVYVEGLSGNGQEIYKEGCRLGLEGIVAKRRGAPYRSGEQESWIKAKCTRTDTFPIVAFVEKLGAKPRRIASLYLGRWEGDRLFYAGKARSGYTEAVARDVREALDPFVTGKSPLSVPVKKPKATWLKPVMLAEIAYGGVTDDGLLREAVFKGLREDLMTQDVKAPSLTPRRTPPARKHQGEEPHIGVPRANILQLLPDAVVPSKEELAAYWRKVARRALPHLGRRPLKLVRHTHDTTFYHKGKLPPVPECVHQLKIEKREGGEGTRLWVDDLDGLIGLVQIGAVELHPWNATVDDIEHADRLVFDLDPGAGIAWTYVIDAALQLRDLLKQEGLESWPKTTGGKGIHLMVPLEPKMTHDKAHRYARGIAQRLAAIDPDRYIVSASMAKRPGRLFIDYLRNGRGTTAVGAYSPRARPGFPIAAPVTWKDVENGIRPDAFRISSPFRKRSRA